jgi:two-component system sensor histidine kinase AlgZ
LAVRRPSTHGLCGGGVSSAFRLTIFPLLSVLPLSRFRPRLFSAYEWWCYWILLPVLLPIGGYFFLGLAFFTDWRTFGLGVGLGIGMYWLWVVCVTIVSKAIIRRYPDVHQTGPRVVALVLAMLVISTLGGILDAWIFSLVPGLAPRLNWATLVPIWALGLVFSLAMCAIMTILYSYSQWQQDQAEAEHLAHEALQRQYDQLKTQLKPHFLFNALNSISVLISEDPARAELVVDQLAHVYRYLLQAGRLLAGDDATGPALVPLRGELDFVVPYAALLSVRFGDALRIELPVLPSEPAATEALVPPLTLLVLLDHAVQTSVLRPQAPLVIRITLPDGYLRLRYERQPRRLGTGTARTELAHLLNQYRRLSPRPVYEHETTTRYDVRIPLLGTAVGLTRRPA